MTAAIDPRDPVQEAEPCVAASAIRQAFPPLFFATMILIQDLLVVILFLQCLIPFLRIVGFDKLGRFGQLGRLGRPSWLIFVFRILSLYLLKLVLS